MKQPLTINEMQTEIEVMRNVIVGLASFVDGDPCWCQWQTLCALIDQRHGVAKMTRGKHLKACLDAGNLRLWQSPSGISLPWKDPDESAKRPISVRGNLGQASKSKSESV